MVNSVGVGDRVGDQFCPKVFDDGDTILESQLEGEVLMLALSQHQIDEHGGFVLVGADLRRDWSLAIDFDGKGADNRGDLGFLFKSKMSAQSFRISVERLGVVHDKHGDVPFLRCTTIFKIIPCWDFERMR